MKLEDLLKDLKKYNLAMDTPLASIQFLSDGSGEIMDIDDNPIFAFDKIDQLRIKLLDPVKIK